MTRQHFIKRSRRTLFFRGRRLALQKLEGDRVLARYGKKDACYICATGPEIEINCTSCKYSFVHFYN